MDIHALLSGGDRRGIAQSNRARALIEREPSLVSALGATYHTGTVSAACAGVDVVLECTGAAPLVFEAIQCVAPNGIVCLTGVSSGSRLLQVDAAGLNNELVLENNVVFGTVNANRRHYAQAADALAQALFGRHVARRTDQLARTSAGARCRYFR